jgi:outer membrane lipoprotein carrier protein
VLCAVCLLGSEVWAASAREQLQSFVSQVQAATGKFSQYTVGTQGQTKPAQTGQFAFQRPGRFKWDVMKMTKMSLSFFSLKQNVKIK